MIFRRRCTESWNAKWKTRCGRLTRSRTTNPLATWNRSRPRMRVWVFEIVIFKKCVLKMRPEEVGWWGFQMACWFIFRRCTSGRRKRLMQSTPRRNSWKPYSTWRSSPFTPRLRMLQLRWILVIPVMETISATAPCSCARFVLMTFDRLIDWLEIWSIGLLWLIAWLIGCLIDFSIDCSFVWPIDWLLDYLCWLGYV